MILDNKRILDDGVQLDDVNYINTKKIDIINTLEVTEKYLYRWDRISFDMYGDSRYGMLLYMFNEYTHPYELKLYDIILIPNLSQLQSNLVVDDYDNSFKSYNFEKGVKQKSKFASYVDKKIPTIETNKKRILSNNLIEIK